MTKKTVSIFYTSRELAELFRVSLGTVHNWAWSGNGPLKPKRIRRRLFWPKAEADAILGIGEGSAS